MPRLPGEPARSSSSRYQAYLLRLWRDAASDAPWRASLEPPDGAAPVRFGTVAALFAFLRDQLADPEADSGPPRGPARPRRRHGGPGPGARRHPGAPGAPSTAAD
jgi:hypothetical protein